MRFRPHRNLIIEGNLIIEVRGEWQGAGQEGFRPHADAVQEHVRGKAYLLKYLLAKSCNSEIEIRDCTIVRDLVSARRNQSRRIR